MAMIMDTTRMAWEPERQGPSDGVAVRGLVNGRGPRRRRGKDSPVGAYRPDGPCPQATARRVAPHDVRDRPARTCGRTKTSDIVRREGQTGALCGPGRAHRSIGRHLWAQISPFLSTPCHQSGPMGSGVVSEWAMWERAVEPFYARPGCPPRQERGGRDSRTCGRTERDGNH